MQDEHPVVVINQETVIQACSHGAKHKGARVLVGKDADEHRSSDNSHEYQEPFAAEVTG